MTLGLTNGQTNRGLGITPTVGLDTYSGQGYGLPVGSSATSGGTPWNNHTTVGVTFDSSKSGIVADLSSGAVVIIKY